jgi:guanylate kinase
MSIAGKLFFIVGPSGVGKGATIELLRKKHPELEYPKSITTRPLREGESEGNPYHFTGKEAFEKLIDENAFLEYAIVHKDYYYGTLLKPIIEALNEGKIIVKELDIQGSIKATEYFTKHPELRKHLKSVFILPPSEATLRKRIKARAPISEAELDIRMQSLKEEVAHAKLCDIQVRFTEDDTIESQLAKLEKAILENK